MTGDDEDRALTERFRQLFRGCSALLVEDDRALAAHLDRILIDAGFARCVIAHDGERAVALANGVGFDIVILDRMIEGLAGLDALRAIRGGGGASAQAPTLFLTALGSERHRIEGLAAGGDDYLVKPVSDVETIARVAALLRRRSWDRTAPRRDEAVIVNGPLRLDGGTMTASLCDRRLELTAREFNILSLLARNAGLPVTRSMLWAQCWSSYHFTPANFANTIDVHVSRLRRKLEAAQDCVDPALWPIIVAVRSQGLLLRRLDPGQP